MTAVTFFSALTVVGQIIIVLVLIGMLGRTRMMDWIGAHALLLMLIVSLTATTGSLFFSEIALWVPCKECWFQRIFMYPQVILLAIALWRHDRGIAASILVLSMFGALFAAHHYIEQLLTALHPIPVDITKPCDLSGVSCTATEIHFSFGYITIPLMALTAFILNAVGSVSVLRAKQ